MGYFKKAFSTETCDWKDNYWISPPPHQGHGNETLRH